MFIVRYLRKYFSCYVYYLFFLLIIRNSLIFIYFMRNRKIRFVLFIFNFKGDFYCTLCLNIKILRRISDFINFFFRFVM